MNAQQLEMFMRGRSKATISLLVAASKTVRTLMALVV